MSKNEDWMNRKWRPTMAWMYMVVCIADFLIFPLLWTAFKAHIGQPVDAWDPLTLKGAGLFHMAMGAVLGIAAWTRGQEKLAYQKSSYEYDGYQEEQVIYKNKKRPQPAEDELI